MTKFKIFAGLGGGFGGARFVGIEEHESRSEASKNAYEYAVEEYESYGGLHGLRTREEVMEEDEIEDEDIGDEAYREEIEGWIEYYVEEVSE